MVSELKDAVLRKALAEEQPICCYSCWVRQGSLEQLTPRRACEGCSPLTEQTFAAVGKRSNLAPGQIILGFLHCTEADTSHNQKEVCYKCTGFLSRDSVSSLSLHPCKDHRADLQGHLNRSSTDQICLVIQQRYLAMAARLAFGAVSLLTYRKKCFCPGA